MAYWLDCPHLANTEHSKEIWRSGSFIAYEWQGRIEMTLDGYSIGTLIGGHDVLNRKHKGDYRKWIVYLRDKDEEKTWRTRENCKEAISTCDFIDDLWLRASL